MVEAPGTDREYAEWFVWAKREVGSETRVCHGVAQAAISAMATGGDREAAVIAARRSVWGHAVVLADQVPPRRRAYAEWFDWIRREYKADSEILHRAAVAALDRLDEGGGTAEGAAAARAAVAAASRAQPANESSSGEVARPPAASPDPAPPTREHAPQPAAASPSPTVEPAAAASPGPLPPPTAAASAEARTALAAAAAAGAEARPKELYGGFLRRVGAYLIDLAVVVAGQLLLSLIVAIAVVAAGHDPTEFGVQIAADVMALILVWLYFAGMESSATQATLGKRALGLRVTDRDGRRIGFGRATARFFLKVLFAIPLGLTYVVVALTPRKQGIHDLLAGTLVFRREHTASAPAPAPPLPVAPGAGGAENLGT